jgi:hypothetical protein
MKNFKFGLAVLFVLGMVIPAGSAEFQFHGDMNNRFLLYTNRNDWFQPDQQGNINRENVSKSYGELKYRFWAEAETNNGNVKGVYGIEVGGIRFGETTQGGSYSGDGVNLETRWAYLDWQLPGVESKARFLMGLQPFSANRYLWQETAAGVNFVASPTDKIDYQLTWMRGVDILVRNPSEKGIKDVDGLLARLNYKPTDETKIGFFGIYQTGDANNPNLGTITPRNYELKRFAQAVKHGFITLGLDGGYNPGSFFLNWDFMYQDGSLDRVIWDDSEFSGVTNTGNFDLNAYFAHVDIGTHIGKNQFVYRFWYASGDNNPSDNKIKAFLSTDVDIDDAIGIFEGLYTDDNTYFTERPSMLDKGFIMNKLSGDFPITDRSNVGAALFYMLTAENIKYTDFSGRAQANDSIGFEIDAYWKYMLYKNLEFKINIGYLFAGDALDAFEVGDLQNGKADQNIWASSMRIRYKF